MPWLIASSSRQENKNTVLLNQQKVHLLYYTKPEDFGEGRRKIETLKDINKLETQTIEEPIILSWKYTTYYATVKNRVMSNMEKAQEAETNED